MSPKIAKLLGSKFTQAAQAPKLVHNSATGKFTMRHLAVLIGCMNFIGKNMDKAKTATIAIISQKLGFIANRTRMTIFQQPGNP